MQLHRDGLTESDTQPPPHTCILSFVKVCVKSQIKKQTKNKKKHKKTPQEGNLVCYKNLRKESNTGGGKPFLYMADLLYSIQCKLQNASDRETQPSDSINVASVISR